MTTFKADHQEFQQIQIVFKDVAKQSWFPNSDENLKYLAKMILDIYDSGSVDMDSFAEICRQKAYDYFNAESADSELVN